MSDPRFSMFFAVFFSSLASVDVMPDSGTWIDWTPGRLLGGGPVWYPSTTGGSPPGEGMYQMYAPSGSTPGGACLDASASGS